MRSTLAVLIAVSLSNLSQANDAKLSPELQRVAPEQTVEVIIQYKQAPTAAHHARVLAAGGEFKASRSFGEHTTQYQQPNSKNFPTIPMSNTFRRIALYSPPRPSRLTAAIPTTAGEPWAPTSPPASLVSTVRV
jgi:hypothetical protein